MVYSKVVLVRLYRPIIFNDYFMSFCVWSHKGALTHCQICSLVFVWNNAVRVSDVMHILLARTNTENKIWQYSPIHCGNYVLRAKV